jgi:hypothetical protein
MSLLPIFATTQEAMMDGEERTTKYAKGAKRETKLLFKGESDRQSSTFAYFAHFVLKSDFS